MRSIKLEQILYWIVKVGAYILPWAVLYIANGMFFPFITGKNFLFRIVVEIMAAGWIGLLIIDFKKYWPRWNFVSVALTIFVGAALLSAIFGVNFTNSFWSNFERMEGLVTHIHLLLLFFVLAGTLRAKREWFILFGISITVSAFLALYGLLEATGEIESLDFAGSRIIATLGNPLYVAAYLSFHVFLSMFLWTQARSIFLKYLLAGTVLFELVVFFLTGARGAFLGMIAGLGSILLLYLFIFKDAKKKFILSGLVIVLLSVPSALIVFKDSSFVQNSDMLARFASISFDAGKARLTLWGTAIEAFKERPVFGWGVGNFNVPFAKHYNPEMFGQEAWFDRTHNMPLEWLVSGGMVGFLAYLALFGSVLWALITAAKKGALSGYSAAIFVGMFIAYLVQLFFVFDTISTYLLFTLMLAFFYTASSSADIWLRKSSLLYSNISQRVSLWRFIGIIASFTAVFALVYMINIRPFMAARELIYGFYIFHPDNAVQVKEQFEKTLSLARGTVGAPEIREHLAINILKFSSEPQSLQKKDVDGLYLFAVEEMEKQINEEAGKNMDIKHNILLAQMYGMLGVFGSNGAAVQQAINQYEKVVAFAPRYVYTYPVFANMLAQTGNFGRAVNLINDAERLLTGVDKFDTQIFYSKPLFYTAARQYDEAYVALRDISVKYGGSDNRLSSVMMESIVATTRSHEKESVVSFLEKVYLLDRTVPSTPLMLAQMHAVLGNPAQARFYASEALKLDSSIQAQVEQFLNALDEKNV